MVPFDGARGQRKNILCSMLHNYTRFQMTSIPLHTLLVLWLFVYRCAVSMKYLREPAYPWAAITQTPFHLHAEVKFNPKTALPVKFPSKISVLSNSDSII